MFGKTYFGPSYFGDTYFGPELIIPGLPSKPKAVITEVKKEVKKEKPVQLKVKPIPVPKPITTNRERVAKNIDEVISKKLMEEKLAKKPTIDNDIALMLSILEAVD